MPTPQRTAETEALLASFGVTNWSAATFNNGVLLYDLAAWRAANFTAQLLDLVRRNSARPFYSLGTQSPMNIVFGATYRRLEPTWNTMFAGDPRLSPGPAALRNAAVVHFNGATKPWLLPAAGPDGELFARVFPGAAARLWGAAQGRTSRQPSPPHLPRLTPHAPARPDFWRWNTRFTLIMMTHDDRRLPGLLQGLASVASNDLLGEVMLISHYPQDACANLTAAVRAALPELAVPLECRHYPENDIQARGAPPPGRALCGCSLEVSFPPRAAPSSAILGLRVRVPDRPALHLRACACAPPSFVGSGPLPPCFVDAQRLRAAA